jgi:predicted GTPase
MQYGIGLLTLRKVFGILETMYVQTESAVGYNEDQLRALEQKINSDEIDYVFSANQIDLTRILNINKPVYRLDYESKFGLDFDEILEDFVNGVVMI